MLKQMFKILKRNRPVAFFVLAFLCLNVGGALCLTICTSLFTAETSVTASESHLSEHCKQAKKAADEREQNSKKFEASASVCCMIPVAMFATPVEKRAEFVITSIAVAETVTAFEFTSPLTITASTPSLPVYRPPPLDRRGERILNSVFRI